MNRQFTKWIKRIGIAISSIAILAASIYLVYNKIYLPHLYNSLYEEGLNNPQKADSIAEQLASLGQSNTAIDLLTKASEKGVVKAQLKLALYLDGYKHDYEKSSYWYLQAALKEDTDAQCQLGINYIYGVGVKQNFNKALYWIEKSANKGDRWAQYELGNLYLNGLAYYDLDYEHTDFWYRGHNIFRNLEGNEYKLSDNGLDEILSNPKIVFLKPNLNMAKHYWNLSAKQGCSNAKNALEKIYE